MSNSDSDVPSIMSGTLRYGLSLLSVGISLAVTLFLQPDLFRTPLFFLSIMVSTWFGGTGPGLLAVLLSTVSIGFVLNPHGIVPSGSHDAFNVAAFLAAAILVGSWSATRRRTEQDLRHTRNELETKVNERTADLRRINELLQNEIVERKRSEEALRGSEDRLQAAINAADIGLWDWDLTSGKVVSVGHHDRLLGFGPNEFDGTHLSFEQRVHPEDIEKLNRVLQRARESGSEYAHEYRVIWPDRSIHWLAGRGRFIYNEAGAPVRMRGALLDITERKRAEGALRESEALWRTMFKDAAVGIALVDEAGRPVQSNPALQRMLGYTEEELSRMSFAEFTHPEDVDTDTAMYRELMEGNRDHYQLEKRYVRKDQKVVWAHLIVSAIRDEIGSGRFVVGMAEDITERKHVEEKNRRLLHSLGERVKELTALHNAARLFQQEGADSQAVIHTLASLLPPAFQYPEVTAVRVRLGETEAKTPGFAETAPVLRTEFTAANGQPGGIEVVYTQDRPPEAEGPFLAEERSLITTLAEMLRISYDHQCAGTALRESEERFRAIAESIPVGLFIYNSPRFSYLNPALEALTGYSRDELYAMNTVEIIHPDMKEIALARGQAILDGEPVPQRFDFRLLTKWGQVRWAYSTVVPITYQGEPSNLSVVFDITERKQAEEELRLSEARYRAVVENQTEFIVRWRPDGTRSFANEAYRRYFQLTPEQTLSSGFMPLVAEADRAAVQSKLSRLISGEVPLETDIHRVIKPDGSISWQEWSDQAIHDESGTIIEFQSVGRDITIRMQAEEELRASHRALRQLAARLQAAREEERIKIAREIHDELGQVLTVLKMDLSLLDRSVSKKSSPMPPTLVSGELRSMMDLVDSTLGSVRRVLKELRPEVLEELGLKAAIEWQAQEFQSRTGIQCLIDASFDDSSVDRDRAIAVYRIFQEALTNVARHSGASQVRVMLQKRHGELQLRVADNGRGIEKEEIAGGKSLGLLGMRERALVLDGNVEVRGTRGEGTIVTLNMPMPGNNSTTSE